jgi:hypothetical protein
MEKLHRQTMDRQSTVGATELLARAVEITAPSTLAITAGSPEIWPRSPASRATPSGGGSGAGAWQVRGTRPAGSGS